MAVADKVGRPIALSVLQDSAARFTSTETLLNSLISIAQDACNSAEQQRWEARRQTAAAARAELAKKDEGQRPPAGEGLR